MLQSHPTARRIANIAAVVISVLVLLLAVLGIVGVWMGRSIAIDTVTSISMSVEQTAQNLESSVTRLNSRIADTRSQISTIQQATTKLSDNIADQGLIMTLLPDAQMQKLEDSATAIRDTFDTIKDALNSARALYSALNRIPGLNLPEPDGGIIDRADAAVTQIQQDIQTVKSTIADIRNKQTAAIGRLNQIAGRVDGELESVQNSLEQVQGSLARAQNAAQQARSVVPPVLTIGTILLTLLQLWVAGTQVLVLRQAWQGKLFA